MQGSIRYDVSFGLRLLRAVPALAGTLVIVAVVLVIFPADIRSLSIDGFVVVGLIGIWRYLWLMTHVIRSIIYEHWMYPKIKFEASNLAEDGKYPDRMFFIVPSFNEKPEVSRRALKSILDEAATIPSKVTVVINAGSAEEDRVFNDACAAHEFGDQIEMMYVRQRGGKRQGMADVLSALADYEVSDSDVIALMDGDTLLGKDILVKCLPLFAYSEKLGAVTTDNIAVTTGNSFYRKWYTLRFAMRHRMMKSQSLSRQLLVLTGRFSLIRAKYAIEPEFISYLENDRIEHWLHGEIKFVTGDDKSTWFALLKHGREMLYVPDAHIYCMEDSGKQPLRQSVAKMHRWFGNMLRNNGRAIKLGIGAAKPFIWFSLVDQRISMFTSLLGPIAAVWSAIWLSWYYLLIYVVLVILVRTIYILLLLVEGHRISITDIPMLLYTQWMGSIVKIYTLFHLHKQKWDSHRTNMANGSDGSTILVRSIPLLEMSLCYVMMIFLVAWTVGVKQ